MTRGSRKRIADGRTCSFYLPAYQWRALLKLQESLALPTPTEALRALLDVVALEQGVPKEVA